MSTEFQNEPFTNFSKPEDRSRMQEALVRVETALGREYAGRIGGEPAKGSMTFNSLNPAQPDEIVGRFPSLGPETVDRAVQAAWKAFETWQDVPAALRADYLFRAAAKMRERKFEFSAWMVYEVGKSWAEADGDVAEAIDFMEFYAREALRYAEKQPVTPVAGEKNELVYIPLGAGVVIPPWNFPLAILVGMTTASIVAGNTVVLKPSSDSPTIAEKFVELMEEVGLPAGVLNFLTGSGAAIGDPLVDHPKTRFIMFTGSREVGIRIHERAAKVHPGQTWLKRVAAEMGGKDSIIVDEEADLAAAVEGVALSAFGFQGQKCSACSRAIVADTFYNEFVERLAERTRKIQVGPPKDPENWMGPLINEGSLKKTLAYIELGKKEGKLVAGGKRIDRSGYFLEPTIFADIPPTGRLAQEEIFAPVLAVIRSNSWEESLAIANNTEYGLTGAVYTRNRQKLDEAKKRFHAGNLYLNRKCTGALVGAHPFGGFNMSGTDSKAGGRDYLLLVSQAKSISEKK